MGFCPKYRMFLAPGSLKIGYLDPLGGDIFVAGLAFMSALWKKHGQTALGPNSKRALLGIPEKVLLLGSQKKGSYWDPRYLGSVHIPSKRCFIHAWPVFFVGCSPHIQQKVWRLGPEALSCCVSDLKLQLLGRAFKFCGRWYPAL